ncbi:MAG TPA: acyl carrier protein [Puia sp.]|nr:acyl carrier protein [Puia sp.]
MSTTVDTSEIAEKVRTIILDKLEIQESALTRTASFSNDLGLDSLDILETFMAIEKKFGIRIDDEAAEKLTTLGAVIDYIVARRN